MIKNEIKVLMYFHQQTFTVGINTEIMDDVCQTFGYANMLNVFIITEFLILHRQKLITHT